MLSNPDELTSYKDVVIEIATAHGVKVVPYGDKFILAYGGWWNTKEYHFKIGGVWKEFEWENIIFDDELEAWKRAVIQATGDMF